VAGAPRAKENFKSMEQCLRAKAGKHRLSARTSFHDCSLAQWPVERYLTKRPSTATVPANRRGAAITDFWRGDAKGR